jgi:hypothetical protein
VQEQSIVVSFATPNLLQDSDPKHEVKDELVATEEDTSSSAISEPSLPNDPPTPTTKTDTAHDAMLMDGENCLDVLNFSTNHAIIEQLSVEPSLDESLSHADLLDVPCDKDDWLIMLQFYMLWNQILLLKLNMLCILLVLMMSRNCCLLYILWVKLNLMFCVI